MSEGRTILDYLEDISNAILDIRSFVHDMSADAFVADKKTVMLLSEASRSSEKQPVKSQKISG